MTPTEWSQQLTHLVGRRVQAVRKAQGLSAQNLSDLCSTRVGYPIPRSTITNLENGRKETCGLQELIVLAEAMSTPLITFLTSDDPVQFLPRVQATTEQISAKLSHRPRSQESQAGDRMALDPFPGRLFVTVPELAEVLEVDPRTLRRSIEWMEIPSVKVGTAIRIPVEKVRHLWADEMTPEEFRAAMAAGMPARRVPGPRPTLATQPPRKHLYISTACHHALHDVCRRACKFCSSNCLCECHVE